MNDIDIEFHDPNPAIGVQARVCAQMIFWFVKRQNDVMAALFDEVLAAHGDAFERIRRNTSVSDVTPRKLQGFRKWCDGDRRVSDQGFHFAACDTARTIEFAVHFEKVWMKMDGKQKRAEVGYVAFTQPASALATDPVAFERQFRDWAKRLEFTQGVGGYMVVADLQDRGGMGDDLCDAVEALLYAHPVLGLSHPYSVLDERVVTGRLFGPAWLVAVGADLAKKTKLATATMPHVDYEADGDAHVLRCGAHEPWNAEQSDETMLAYREMAAWIGTKQLGSRRIGSPASVGAVFMNRGPFRKWLDRFDGV